MTGHFKIATAAAVYVYDAVWLALAPPPFSDTFWVAISTAIPATIAATGALVVGIRTSRRVNENSAKSDVIIGHVNSAAAKAAGEIDALRQEIALMREQASDKKQTAALLAQAVASAASVTAASTPPREGEPE